MALYSTYIIIHTGSTSVKGAFPSNREGLTCAPSAAGAGPGVCFCDASVSGSGGDAILLSLGCYLCFPDDGGKKDGEREVRGMPADF